MRTAVKSRLAGRKCKTACNMLVRRAGSWKKADLSLLCQSVGRCSPQRHDTPWKYMQAVLSQTSVEILACWASVILYASISCACERFCALA